MELLDDNFVKEIEDFMKAVEERSAGLKEPQTVEAPECLTAPLEALRRMSFVQLGECSYELAQYNMYINRQINQKRAWIKWLRSRHDQAAAIEIPNISGNYGFNERVMIAKNNPTICRKIANFQRKIQLELDMIESIPQCVRFIADSIKDIKLSRISEEKHGA